MSAPENEDGPAPLKALKEIFPKVNYYPSLSNQQSWNACNFHIATYSKNKPCEDFGTFFFDKNKKRVILSVLDGHAGPYCAKHLQLLLPTIINQKLNHINQIKPLPTTAQNVGSQAEKKPTTIKATLAAKRKRALQDDPDIKAKITVQTSETHLPMEKALEIATAIQEAYAEANADFCEKIVDPYFRLFNDPKINKTQLMKITGNYKIYRSDMTDVGACSLTAMIEDDLLYVAHAGDCRAVLCRGETAIDLTADHSYENPRERRRIAKACKDPRAFIYSKCAYRLAGRLEPSRAMGDFFLADPRYCLPEHKQFVPYLSAEPDVYVSEIKNEDRFLVLASDGLWNCFDSQKVVNIILSQIKGEAVGNSLSSSRSDSSVERNKERLQLGDSVMDFELHAKQEPEKESRRGVRMPTASSSEKDLDSALQGESNMYDQPRTLNRSMTITDKYSQETDRPSKPSLRRKIETEPSKRILTRSAAKAKARSEEENISHNAEYHQRYLRPDLNISRLLIERAKEQGPVESNRDFDDQCIIVYFFDRQINHTEIDSIESEIEEFQLPTERWENFRIKIE